MLRLMLGLVLLCAASCVSPPERTPAQEAPSMLCQVLAAPAEFHGREVTVRGIFASDYQHGSLLMDPDCDNGLTPYSAHDEIGKNMLDGALCSEEGGLVEIAARGRVEARPGEIPNIRFYVSEYSEPRAIAFDPAWGDGLLRMESTTRWDGRRRRMCFHAGYIDPETMERREPAQ